MKNGDQVFIVAEIGINHNGDIEIAKKLIAAAHGVGCNAVKFQKRTIDVVYSAEELSRPRDSVFGKTNGDLKRGLEFDQRQYDEIDRYCRAVGIPWYASPWDERSVDFLLQYDIPYLKIASPCVTDRDLVLYCCRTGKPLMVSTGMCDLPMIQKIVDLIRNNGGEIACLYHCNSTYPCRIEDLNLRAILTLKETFPDIPIGYSGHETGVPPSVLTAALGVVSIERHITLDRAMWGSDQAASLEIEGLRVLIRAVSAWPRAAGDGQIRVYESEGPIIEKLRRKDTLDA